MEAVVRTGTEMRQKALDRIYRALRDPNDRPLWDTQDLAFFSEVLLDAEDLQRSQLFNQDAEDAARYRAIRREIITESTLEFVVPSGCSTNAGEIDALVDRHLRGVLPKPPRRYSKIRVVKE